MAKKVKGDLLVENDLQVDRNLSLPSESTEKALELDSSGNVKSSTVTSTELSYVSGTTSNIQGQIDLKANENEVIKKDGSVDYTADQSLAGNKLTNLGTPTNDNDAARKVDVDAAAAGVKVKDPTRVVAESNSAASGLLVIDGVTLVDGDRVLLIAQTDPIDNGIYDASLGAWSRSSDFDGAPNGEASRGNVVFVTEGTERANTNYVLRATDAADPDNIAVGTDTQEWTIYSRAEQVQAGDGLDKSGLTLSVDSSDLIGSGLEDDGSNNIRIASTAAGTGLTGGSGSALSIDFDTTGTKAVTADVLASQSTGEGASLIGVEDSAGDFTATDVEGVLAELQTDINSKQDDVITTEGDLIVGNSSGEESRLPIGASGTVLRSNGTTASWQAIQSTGDIEETSFSGLNDQSVAVNVVGFSFANLETRSFKAHGSIVVDADSDLYEEFDIYGIQKGSDWEIAEERVGDMSGVQFTITTTGQIQYISDDYTGFNSLDIRFKAITTSI